MNNEPQMNNEPESELPESETPKTESGVFKVAKWMYDIVEIFCIAIIAVILIFSFCLRTCRVDGRSMNNTLAHGEVVVISDIMYEPTAGDIVVFHLVNEYYQEPLVKRVIATEGQHVKIDLNEKQVYVNGSPIEDKNVYLENNFYNPGYFDYNLTRDENGHEIFIATVPEGKIFVMGDNRNHSTDSRSYMVGFVDKECVLGKAIFRLSPFTSFN